ncbi:MAG: PAS domain S-box protein [Asticcacaulis sp.]
MTDIVQAQTRLERSEARYRLLADHANDIITVFDLDGRFNYVSPAVTKVLAMRPRTCSARASAASSSPRISSAPQAAYAGYVRGGAWQRQPAHPVPRPSQGRPRRVAGKPTPRPSSPRTAGYRASRTRCATSASRRPPRRRSPAPAWKPTPPPRPRPTSWPP